MDSDGQLLKWAKPALILAAVLLVATLAYASFRDKGPVPEANVTAAADDAPSIESLQAAAASAPKDPDAWARLGMAHYDRDEFADAVVALERATSLAPSRANLWSLLGETRVYASTRDPMPAAAVEAFGKALAIDPKNPVARYFMAVRKDLAKDHKGAIDDWLALLADTPPGAPWEANLRRTIEQVGAINKIEVAGRMAALRQPAPPSSAAPLPGPNAQQVAEAARLSPSDQDIMARGMVDSLEAKLRANPRNVPGWIMLMRSRMTLGEPAKAAAALKDGVAANPGAKAELEGEARTLGVPR
ncbi:MAG: tetratricopeptide repeat protein [Pseudomonadota bacterium]